MLPHCPTDTSRKRYGAASLAADSQFAYTLARNNMQAISCYLDFPEKGAKPLVTATTEVLGLSHRPFRPLSVKRSRFWSLPLELRELIYLEVLVEPDLLNRRHDAFCDRYNDDDLSLPMPQLPPCVVRATPADWCHCVKRQGLGLLLANRQIYAEAAPIFWGRNKFWLRGVEPVLCSNAALQEKLRQYVKHIAANYRENFTHNAKPIQSTTPLDDIWDTILQLRNLRTLELDSLYMDLHYHKYSRLQTCCLHLTQVTMIHVRPYFVLPGWPPETIRSIAAAALRNNSAPIEHVAILVKISRSTPLTIPDGDVFQDVVTMFAANLINNVSVALWDQVLHHQIKVLPGAHPAPPQLPPDLYDSNKDVTLTLRDGTTRTFPVYGLPNSPATCARNAEQRRVDDAVRLAAGLLTRKQTEAERRALKDPEKRARREVDD
ncbi:hypothetical protein FQN50_009592 [Emmonsiellopsis sp. PD_5]|nr:hypothetical protein FQN50_009592 [Emmonsiellopsis sp. PD_5]